MRLFKSALFLFVFFIIFSPHTFAAIIGGGNQQPTQKPDSCANPPATETSFEGAGFSTVPAMECIDEAIQKVTLTFHNLTEGEEYKICAGGKFCLIDEAVLPSIITHKLVIDIPEDQRTVDSNGDLTIEVCGDGEKRIKLDCDNGDYFHGGNAYVFSIGVVDDGRYLLSTKAGFYVARSYPRVRIIPNTNITTNTAVNVRLEDTSPRRPGGGNRNNYQVLIKGGEFYDEEQCLNPGETTSFDKTPPVGKFTITIKAQIHEGGIRRDYCQGGFTYYKIACEATNPRDGGGSCADPEDSKDPQEEEYKQFIEDLKKISGEENFILYPCGSGKLAESTKPGDCLSLDTAIGSISATPKGFITDIFSFVLAIAGLGAVMLIIYSGYLFMTSQGDKERIAGARETITSAIIGLLFIILSFIVLEIIGFDILRIPGFSR